MKKLMIVMMALVVGAAELSAFNPNYPTTGTIEGTWNQVIYPGQGALVGAMFPNLNGACHLTVEKIIIEAASQGWGGQVSLEIAGTYHDTVDVPYQTGVLPHLTLSLQNHHDLICSTFKSPILINTGTTPVFLTRSFIKYSNHAYSTREMDCISLNDKMTKCYFGQHSYDVKLIKQYTSSPCIEGSSWAVSWPNKEIWVNKSCRGRFRIYYKK